MRVLGVSAPHYIQKNEEAEITSLNSNDPFSLYNAFKVVVYNAVSYDPYWSNSNWRTQEGRDNSILLLQYFNNEKENFKNKLDEIKPNLLLIGTMSLGFAGAVKLAEIAKQKFNDKIFIVLGGKHVNETFWKIDSNIHQLQNSPLKLMQQGKIPFIFDMVASGDCEEIIAEIGRAIYIAEKNGLSYKSNVYNLMKFQSVKGDWVIGFLNEINEINFVTSKNDFLKYDSMPLTSELFKINGKIDIFENTDMTAHTMSYLSKGCIHRCFYCSESRELNGNLKQINTASDRLYKNLEAIKKVAKEKYGIDKCSAYVEDSIILGGITESLNRFCTLLIDRPLNIPFGCQLTIDIILDPKNQEIIKKLSKQGLYYIFVGLETSNEGIAKAINKNKQVNRSSWLIRNEKVIEFMKENNIKYGLSVLIGLGESQQDRINIMEMIKKWQKTYGKPNCVSMNLATRHPMRKNTIYDYIDWGTSQESPYLPYFTSMFGEASEKYTYSELPDIEELEQIKYLYDEIRSYT